MKRAFAIAVMILAGTALLAAQDVVDRIVATVNRQPVLLSDWDLTMRYEAFLAQRPLPLSAEAARATLDRLIDQQLLREQMASSHLRPVGGEEVENRLREVRRATPGADTEAGFRLALARYGLNEAELAARVKDQLEILRFVEMRLRPAVRVDRRSIQTYYNDTLLPELRKQGAREEPLAEVSSQIEELLSQERLDALLADWLKQLREGSEIHLYLPAPPAEPPATRQETR
jgi:hypothetical protein